MSTIDHRPSTIAIIPARFASTRFPGKPLADRTGKPLIQHVVERAGEATLVSRVVVATDDDRIADAVRGFGGEAVLTRADHPNGTSRLAEAVDLLSPNPDPRTPDPTIINVQGDEPEIEPRVIDELILGLDADPGASMATLASPFADDEDPADPNIVKLVVDRRGRALMFTRSLVPDTAHATAGVSVTVLKHPGLYAYRASFLRRYVELPPAPLEQAEQLEQLRALEHGHAIAVVQTTVRHHGIDTPEQYEAFVQRCAAGSA